MPPVKMAIDLDVLRYCRRTLQECAEDIQANLDAEYPKESREQYPSYQRRYDRDRSVVTDALYCVDQLNDAGVE